VKERHIWFRIGWITIVLGGVILLLTTIAFFVNELSGKYLSSLVNVSAFCISLGGIILIFFSRVGWHKSKFMDVVFNRLSLILIIFGFLLSFFFPYLSKEAGFILVGLGVILLLLGVRYQSVVTDGEKDENIF
jgi:hypothetical protein